MKVFAAFALILPFFGIAQPPDNSWAAESGDKAALVLASTGEAGAFNTLNDFSNSLEQHRLRFKNDTKFLEYLFFKTHNRFLKSYQQYATMDQLFTSGRYNCLTGTALYALLMDKLNLPYQITETTHHIFLEVQLGGKDFLFEATDPMHGFVADMSEIDQRLNDYKVADSESEGRNAYHFQERIYNTLALEELPGLMYYNKSIDAFNNHNFDEATAYLELATHFYYSSRIDELLGLISDAVNSSSLDNSEKLYLSQRLQSIRVSAPLSLSRAF